MPNGTIPSLAPMKNSLLKTFLLENKHPCGVTLLLCTCFLLFAFMPGAAQLRNQRCVTELQLRGAAEGSRVTIVSDTALDDYEAFRRGDRFYVKIPLADFASTVPQLRADGFEDVHVQKLVTVSSSPLNCSRERLHVSNNAATDSTSFSLHRIGLQTTTLRMVSAKVEICQVPRREDVMRLEQFRPVLWIPRATGL